MNRQPTQPPRTSLEAQRTTFAVLADLAVRFPGLPAAYTTVHTTPTGLVTLQLPSFAAWEIWREFLGIDSADVKSSTIRTTDVMIEFTTQVDGVTFIAYATDLVISAVRAGVPA